MTNLLTIQDVADQLKMSYTKVYDLVTKKKLIRASQIGRQWRIKQADLDDYVDGVGK